MIIGQPIYHHSSKGHPVSQKPWDYGDKKVSADLPSAPPPRLTPRGAVGGMRHSRSTLTTWSVTPPAYPRVTSSRRSRGSAVPAPTGHQISGRTAPGGGLNYQRTRARPRSSHCRGKLQPDGSEFRTEHPTKVFYTATACSRPCSGGKCTQSAEQRSAVCLLWSASIVCCRAAWEIERQCQGHGFNQVKWRDNLMACSTGRGVCGLWDVSMQANISQSDAIGGGADRARL